MSPKLTVFKKEERPKDIFMFLMITVVPVNLFMCFLTLANKSTRFYTLLENNKLTCVLIFVAILMLIAFLHTQTPDCKRMRSDISLHSLSDVNTQPLRLKIDAYFTGLQATTTLHKISHIHIDEHGAHTSPKGKLLDAHHTQHLNAIIKKELSPFLSKRKLKLIIHVGIKIPLFTTQPSAHDIFKMAALQTQKPLHTFCAFGMRSSQFC